MIKRRFYRFDHGNRDDPSGSSSSSDSEVEGDATYKTEVDEDESDEDEVVQDVRENGEASFSTGYESEDSSANEVNLDSSGSADEDDVITQNDMHNIDIATAEQGPEKEKFEFDETDCVLKCKSVFKCKLCPRIVCLSEETIKAHLISKKHARSEKLRREGRLKIMLNDDGQIEDETPSDDPDSTVSGQPKKKRKGPWKQWKRSGQKEAKSGKARPSKDKRAKRHKNGS